MPETKNMFRLSDQIAPMPPSFSTFTWDPTMFVWLLPRNLPALKSGPLNTPFIRIGCLSVPAMTSPWSNCPLPLNSHVKF